MIFDEFQLASINMKNRIIRSATHDGLADENGAPTEELIKKYETLAKNDIGCIITGYVAVSENGVSPYPRMLKMFKPDNLDKYKELVDRVHNFDTPIICQLAHTGRQTSSKAIKMQKVAPSNVLHILYPDKAKVLSSDEIYKIIEDFKNAAIQCEKAGFDGIQLHGGHGYLLHDFMSEHGNRRKDEWGGTIENRCRIVKLIVQAIKSSTKLPVFIKISAEDNRKHGMRVDTTIEILKILEEAGLDGVEVSCGTVADGMNTMRSKTLPMDAVFKYREPLASMPHWLNKTILPIANLFNPLIKQPSPLENFNVENAAKIKGALNIPVIVVGGIHKLDDMESILLENKADCISMCRPFICQPGFAKYLKEGKQTESKCIMCNYCGLIIEKEPTRCLYGRIKKN